MSSLPGMMNLTLSSLTRKRGPALTDDQLNKKRQTQTRAQGYIKFSCVFVKIQFEAFVIASRAPLTIYMYMKPLVDFTFKKVAYILSFYVIIK